jgi:glycosyltransferase involved in cell wall biosynthesis
MYHNIRILAESHSVRVISFIENEAEGELLRSLEGVCESIVGVRRIPDFRPHWLSLDPFLVREFSTPQMYREIETALRTKRVDVLQCEYLQMAQFHRPDIFSVLTIHETLSANAYQAFQRERDPLTRFKLFYRWMQMLRYEVLMTRRFDRVVTMTEHDASYLRSYVPGGDVRAIPIGADPDEFEPFPEENNRPLEVLFVGNFRHTPNVEAAEFLVREAAPHFPALQFVMPGNDVPSQLRRERNLVFPGYIAETKLLYRRPNTIVAAPLFSGTGQRVKLLEAFSMACPVITTTVGALGFRVRQGEEALIADTPEEFRAALQQLVASPQLRRELGAKARAMILRDFDWRVIGPRLLDVVQKTKRGEVGDL